MTSDPGSISLYVFILVLTVIINAVIAAMNTAFGSVNANTVFRKAEDESDVAAQRAASILRKSFRCMYTNRMLSYILLVSGILISTLLGGHGGMDYIMDYRLVYCLRNGLPLDMDVYDLAEWCCVSELGAISIENGSAPVAIPDFTRGAWNRLDGFRHAFAK